MYLIMLQKMEKYIDFYFKKIVKLIYVLQRNFVNLFKFILLTNDYC